MFSSSPSKADSFLPAHLIPRRFSSLPAYQQAQNKTMKRKASNQSRLTTSSSISEFLDVKIDDAEADAEDFSEMYNIAQAALERGDITKKEYLELTGPLMKKIDERKKEIDHVKKQRKIVQEDLEERCNSFTKAEEQYANLVSKIVVFSGDNKNKQGVPKFNDKAFKKEVGEYLNADRENGDRWCHVFGKWFDAREIKAAHLVPRILNGPELAYAFGVEQLSMNDCRIGITLHHVIEEALDHGKIVFMPVQDGQDLRWKVVISDSVLEGRTGPAGVPWNDIAGKFLTFRDNNRPARRYLYFRYIMTYLQCKRESKSLTWATSSEHKGYIWATPGLYLREGMLATLAKVTGDVFEPQAWEMQLKKTTFVDTSGSPAMDGKSETEMARKLSMQMTQASVKGDDSDDEYA